MKHIVLHTLPAWGHTKPLIALMVLIAELREDVVITYLACGLYSKIVDELAKIPQERYRKVKERVRVVQIPDSAPENILENPAFEGAFGDLYRTGTITCLSSGKTFSGLPTPRLAIVDPWAGYLSETIRSYNIPIVAWNSAGPLIREFGPEHLGGRGDLLEKAKTVAASGEDLEEAGAKLFAHCEGKVVNIPGYPPMYDYEWFPQELDLRQTFRFLQNGYKYINESQAIMTISTRILEKESIDAFEEHLNALRKDLVPLGFVSATFPQPELGKEDDSSGVLAFLDKIQLKHGDKSLIYIAFGTIWWPADPGKLYIIIDKLLQTNTPFLLSHTSPRANVPEEVEEKIASSECGMSVNWAPQDAVLKHQSVGWFLTHGGWNSVQEAIRYDVPLIFWPMAADQPTNAALITLTHKAGFELLSVRTGEHAKKPYRCQDRDVLFTQDAVSQEFQKLLEEIKGDEGEVVRSNFSRLSHGISRVWDEEGEARLALDTFLKKYVD